MDERLDGLTDRRTEALTISQSFFESVRITKVKCYSFHEDNSSDSPPNITVPTNSLVFVVLKNFGFSGKMIRLHSKTMTYFDQ